jgi:hypothetical protein
MDIFVCSHCADLTPKIGCCMLCGNTVTENDWLQPGRGLGLIGFPNTGKTCLLATMHDQLMHSAPEWRVEVSDQAFDRLTNDYWRLIDGAIPSKTQLDGDGQSFFSMTVSWQGTRLPLLMKDMAGEFTWRMAEVRNPIGPAIDRDEEYESLDRNKIYLQFLAQCKSVLVAIGCWEMLSALQDEKRLRQIAMVEDKPLGQLFRNLLRINDSLTHVEIVLVGVDVFGTRPAEAIPRGTEAFESAYRLFPGVLQNAGLSVDTVCVSNIGFGDEPARDSDSGKWKFRGAPQPFQVLEPLRRSLLPYLQEKMRQKVVATSQSVPSTSLRADSPSGDAARRTEEQFDNPSDHSPSESVTKRRRAFLSYRRESGADTARVIRTSLASRGWDAFLDVEDLGSSYFDDRILLEIQRAEAFIVVLAPGALDRCADSGDWLRREISHAIKRGKKIVPVTKNGFTFGRELTLPPDLADLPRFNCIEYSHQYFQATMDRLLAFLGDDGAMATEPSTAAHASTDEPPLKIRWKCACGHTIGASRKDVGRHGKCPFCGRKHSIPDGTSLPD